MQASVFYNNVGKIMTKPHLQMFLSLFLSSGILIVTISIFVHLGGSMAASYAAYFITLRDKMLISKRTEWIGIAVLFQF